MNTVSVEISDTLNLKLTEVAKHRGASVMQLIREALEQYLALQEPVLPTDSFGALASEILDAPSDENSPTDLSTDKKHMEGYGQW
jgi:metal-responsive CopG/Arc/MetJ family transcriptional regulator